MLSNVLLLLVLHLLARAHSEKVYLEYYYSNENSEPAPEDIESRVFSNLRALLQSGDEEFGVDKYSPYEDIDVATEDDDVPFNLSIDGVDKFTNLYTLYHVNGSVEFKMLFPKIFSRLSQETEWGSIELEWLQINTTLTGLVTLERQAKCIQLLGFDASVDFDSMDYSLVKKGLVEEESEELVLSYVSQLMADSKDEVIEQYETYIEEEVERVFNLLGCWYFSSDKLLTSIQNDIHE